MRGKETCHPDLAQLGSLDVVASGVGNARNQGEQRYVEKKGEPTGQPAATIILKHELFLLVRELQSGPGAEVVQGSLRGQDLRTYVFEVNDIAKQILLNSISCV